MAKSSAKRTGSPCTIGVDLGGTKVAAALVDSSGEILAETTRPTVPQDLLDQDPRAGTQPTAKIVRKHIAYVIDAMAEAVVEILEQNPKRKLKGIGIGAAGPMNIDKGTLEFPSNLKGWAIVPLVKLFMREIAKRKIICKVDFQNDAIAAALGEGWIGRARGCKTYAMITVGTGIGTGVIFNGRPAQSRGMGSEWGHLLVESSGLMRDPEAFYPHSVEGLASGTGLVIQAKRRGLAFETAREISEAAGKGDSEALALFSYASEALAALLYGLSLGFHPEKFVFSGGMMRLREFFLPQTISLYRKMMAAKNPKFLAPVQIAKLGTEAGVVGAARLPWLTP